MILTLEKSKSNKPILGKATLNKKKLNKPTALNHNAFMKSFWNTLETKALDKPLVFNSKFEKYLNEVESITGVQIYSEQRALLKKEIDNKEYTRIPVNESKAWRNKFRNDKKYMIKEWEQHTHMQWKKYDHDVYSNKGKIVRRVGQNWDAHELILNCYKSPHEWWNITPAPFPEHQQKIHGKDSTCTEIFDNLTRK